MLMLTIPAEVMLGTSEGSSKRKSNSLQSTSLTGVAVAELAVKSRGCGCHSLKPGRSSHPDSRLWALCVLEVPNPVFSCHAGVRARCAGW